VGSEEWGGGVSGVGRVAWEPSRSKGNGVQPVPGGFRCDSPAAAGLHQPGLLLSWGHAPGSRSIARHHAIQRRAAGDGIRLARGWAEMCAVREEARRKVQGLSATPA
jgi:hypothetical protein